MEKGNFKFASAGLVGLREAFFGATTFLLKRLSRASAAPQKRSRSHSHPRLYVLSDRGEFHDQWTRWSMRARVHRGISRGR
jgi:hypothetical protein